MPSGAVVVDAGCRRAAEDHIMIGSNSPLGYWDVMRAAARLTSQHEDGIRKALEPSASTTAASVQSSSANSSSSEDPSSSVPNTSFLDNVEWWSMEEAVRQERLRDVRALFVSLAGVLEGLGELVLDSAEEQEPTRQVFRGEGGSPAAAAAATAVNLQDSGTVARCCSSSSCSTRTQGGHDDKCLSGGASPTSLVSILSNQRQKLLRQQQQDCGSATRGDCNGRSKEPTCGTPNGALGCGMATGDASPPLVPEVVVVSRAEQVLGNSALVHVIFGYLVEPRAASRDTLSKLAGVSALWADVAKSDVYWMPIARELFPLWGNNNLAAARVGEGAAEATASLASMAAWQQVKRYGRSVVHRLINIAEWHEGISLSFEIFDECDGLRLFAAQGPIRVLGTTKPGSLALKLIQPKTFHSSPFSAGSRDPQMRFGSVTDYFTDGHDPTYPAALNVRVMASDERTGRMALVYASNKATKHWIEPMPNNNAAMPEGSLLVNQHWTRVATSVTGQAMQMLTVFFVGPVEGQEEDVAESDRLYRVLETQTLYITLQFKSENSEEIGKFILGLLNG